MKNITKFTNDDAIVDIKQDEFKRKDFTNNILKSINGNWMNSKNSIVMGITGGWGTGKSSIMHLLKNKLKNKFNVIDFDVLFHKSVNSNLTSAFFQEMSTKKGFSKEIRKLFKKVIKIASLYPDPTIKIASGLIGLFGADTTNKSLEDKKNKLSNKFKALKNKTIIFIDDLDRLDKEELLEALQLVKLNANFRNVYYILAYDKQIVSYMVDEEYLEKIVNMEFACPEINGQDLENYFSKIFDNLFEKIKNKKDDDARLRMAFTLLLENSQTPRKIKKMYNLILWDIIQLNEVDKKEFFSELNISDVVLLNVLKFNYEKIYKEIYLKRKEFFTAFLTGDFDYEKFKIIIKENKDINLTNIINFLFNNDLKKDNNVTSSLETFERFFSSNKEISFTEEDFFNIFDKGKSLDKLEKEIDKIIKNSNQRIFLKKLLSNQNQIFTEYNRLNILISLSRISNNLDRFSGSLIFSDLDICQDICFNIIKTLNKKEFNLFVNKILKTNQINFILFMTLNRLTIQEKNYGLHKSYDKKEIAIFKKDLLNNFKKNYVSLEGIGWAQKKIILNILIQLNEKPLVELYLAHIDKDDNKLLDFIECFKGISTSYSSLRTKTNPIFDKEFLKSFFDLERLIKRLKKIKNERSKEIIDTINGLNDVEFR